MPAKNAEPHNQLVALAIKVRNQTQELLVDRVINEELKKARKELADIRKRTDKFFLEFRRIADELELGSIDGENETESSEEDS
jgi:hypothetical protein